MERFGVKPTEIVRVEGNSRKVQPDLLVVEEPLEIRLNFGKPEARRQHSLSITMRTVGHDFELVLGFLFGEGILPNYQAVKSMRYCTEPKTQEEVDNIVIVELDPAVDFNMSALERHFYTTSSCGVCGKSSIEALAQGQCTFLNNDFEIGTSLIHQLPTIARKQQSVFEHTGGLHAATLFSSSGELLLMREDIGRHNAVDKIVGARLAAPSLQGEHQVLLVSGRAGFELVQKTITAGIPIMAAVGAPSSLAVDLARQFNLTLLGFVRNERFNIYSGSQRIQP